MRTIEVKQGQTFFDVVIEATESLIYVFDVAKLNNIRITENLVIGQKILIPDEIITKKSIFHKGHYPASKEYETTNETDVDYLLPQTLPHI